MKKFNKNQIVFQACHTFAAIQPTSKNGDLLIREVMIGVVIERQVESCGQKQTTFFNRGGNDSVFGRTMYAGYNNAFATQDEAFAALKSSPSCSVICPDVYSDANNSSFDDVKSGQMNIAEK